MRAIELCKHFREALYLTPQGYPVPCQLHAFKLFDASDAVRLQQGRAYSRVIRWRIYLILVCRLCMNVKKVRSPLPALLLLVVKHVVKGNAIEYVHVCICVFCDISSSYANVLKVIAMHLFSAFEMTSFSS